MSDTTDESMAALRERCQRLEAALVQLDERLIVANALAQAAIIATGIQRMVNESKLIDDFQASLFKILAQMGKQDLLDRAVLPPFPK